MAACITYHEIVQDISGNLTPEERARDRKELFLYGCSLEWPLWTPQFTWNGRDCT
jgi:hypothetical protein